MAHTLDQLCVILQSATFEGLPCLPLLMKIATILDEDVDEFWESTDMWCINLRTSLRRLLQSRNSTEEYRRLSFRLCSLAISKVGWRLFQTDPQLCVLLGSLVAIEIRLILDQDPNQVPISPLTALCSLADHSLSFVENADLALDDSMAILLSVSCRDTAAFLSAYLIRSSSDCLSLPSALVQPLFRLLCSFLTMGGCSLLDPPSVPLVVLRLVQEAASSPAVLVPPLLLAIRHLPPSTLPSCFLSLLIQYIDTENFSVDDVHDLIFELNDSNWLIEFDVDRLNDLVERMEESSKLQAIVSHVKQCAYSQ